MRLPPNRPHPPRFPRAADAAHLPAGGIMPDSSIPSSQIGAETPPRARVATNEVLSATAPGVLEQFSRTRAGRAADIIDKVTPLVTGEIFRYGRDLTGTTILDGRGAAGYRGNLDPPRAGKRRGAT